MLAHLKITYLADHRVGPLIWTQEGVTDLGEKGGAAVTPGLLLLIPFLEAIRQQSLRTYPIHIC